MTRPTLERCDPTWEYNHPATAQFREVLRPLRVWRVSERRVLAVVTEQGAGISVVNSAESAIAQLEEEYPGEEVVLIARIPPGFGCPFPFDCPKHSDEVVEFMPLDQYGGARMTPEEWRFVHEQP